jgi:hypothetical protein
MVSSPTSSFPRASIGGTISAHPTDSTSTTGWPIAASASHVSTCRKACPLVIHCRRCGNPKRPRRSISWLAGVDPQSCHQPPFRLQQRQPGVHVKVEPSIQVHVLPYGLRPAHMSYIHLRLTLVASKRATAPTPRAERLTLENT